MHQAVLACSLGLCKGNLVMEVIRNLLADVRQQVIPCSTVQVTETLASLELLVFDEHFPNDWRKQKEHALLPTCHKQ